MRTESTGGPVGKRLASLRDDLAKGTLQSEDFNAAKARVMEEIGLVQGKMAQHKSDLLKFHTQEQSLSLPILLEWLDRKVGALSLEERQQVVARVVKRIEVLKGQTGPELQVHWAVPAPVDTDMVGGNELNALMKGA